MPADNLMDMIDQLLNETPENSVHSKNRTADGKKKDPKTEKPKAQPTGKNEVEGSHKGGPGQLHSGKDEGDMNKGKIASGASTDTKGVEGKGGSQTPLNQNSGVDDKAPSGEKGKYSSDASSNTQGVLGKSDKAPLNQKAGMDDENTKLKEESEDEDEDDVEEACKSKKESIDNPGDDDGDAIDQDMKKKGVKEDDDGDEDDDDGDEDEDDDDDDELEEKKLKFTKGQKRGAFTKADNAAKNAAVSLAGPNGSKYKVKKNIQGKWVKEETGDELLPEEAELAEEIWMETFGADGKEHSGKEPEVNKKQRPDVEKGNNEPKTKRQMDDVAGKGGSTTPLNQNHGMQDQNSKLKESDEALEEEFKEKAQLIFETAVNEKVSGIREELEEDYKALLEQSLEQMNERIEEYMDYAVSEWIAENNLEIKYSLRTEIAENFIKGLKGLFEESYIDIPDEEISIVDELTEEVESYKDQLVEAVEKIEQQDQIILENTKNSIILELTEDLTQTQSVKLEELAEHVEAADVEEFKHKLTSLKEAHFVDIESSSYSSLTEEVMYSGDEEEVLTEGSMGAYAHFLSKTVR